VSVTVDDVRRIAALARLGIDPARLPSLVAELNQILDHMEVLEAVQLPQDPADASVAPERAPLREDRGPQLPVAHPLESFGPQVRDGFFLVPRLATHEDPAGAGG
jgi:aspartyl-tRNA(Asn)/glutamyl-tRNA(Gln) amidotransferase subunit C